MPRSTQPLRDAIAEYDRTQPERDAALAAIVDQQSCDDYFYFVEAVALFKVRQAFFEVTSDRNSFDTCMSCVSITDARKLARLDEIADIEKTP